MSFDPGGDTGQFGQRATGSATALIDIYDTLLAHHRQTTSD
ncbi:hypothetical protein ACFWF7_37255 [Nocardia sp. NPDC060256]